MNERSERKIVRKEKEKAGGFAHPFCSVAFAGNLFFCQRTKESSDFCCVSPEAGVEYREKRFYEMPDLRIRRSKTYTGQTSRKLALSPPSRRTPTSNRMGTN
ncbi:hypothetical protein TNIN_22181 [Trichonephila inaurata madagascariensis]|uniref:Uncharacterized protein n=1 Tax=Trichonephila inaurata madagascariensis TaxID=2747483 RepID=A0A8X7CQG3_9ARAC|nr:hypothetical protein TNIN_22181 [Trichonephila inaurata madagascariensis]